MPGRRWLIASQQALRLSELLESEGVEIRLARAIGERPRAGSIQLTPIALGGGLIVDGLLVLVSDAEIFGFRKRRRPTRTRQGIRRDIVSTLEIGDLPGARRPRHRALRRARAADDRGRASASSCELQYAEGDRLYVPADQARPREPLRRPGDHRPSLTRLGSQEWARAKRRVKPRGARTWRRSCWSCTRARAGRGPRLRAGHAPGRRELEASFPYVETPDQLQAIREVKADMEQPRPMDRLICGDVGYGKTEVALRAAFKAVADGKQVAVLVPTTVLAQQHFNTFRERLAAFPVRVEMLSRFRTDKRAARDRRRRRDGQASTSSSARTGCCRRTCAFKDLGLVIIDEEQRFGVSAQGAAEAAAQRGGRADAHGDADPAHAAHGAGGHPRHERRSMTPPEERLPIRTYVTAVRRRSRPRGDPARDGARRAGVLRPQPRAQHRADRRAAARTRARGAHRASATGRCRRTSSSR